MTDQPGFTSAGTAIPDDGRGGGGVLPNQITLDELQRSLSRAPTQIAVAENSIEGLRRDQDKLEKSFDKLEKSFDKLDERVGQARKSRRDNGFTVVGIVIAIFALVITAVRPLL